MPGFLTNIAIAQQLRTTASEFTNYCSSTKDDAFFYQPVDKWSAAQQVKHLITSVKTATLAYTLPKFMVRWIAGKPNRNSRSFDELLAKYKMKLGQGGRASKRFVPKPIPATYGKEKLLKKFIAAMYTLANAITRKWNEPLTDQYIAPHPLLGKITLRELGYFTIFHAEHHLNSIKERIKEFEIR
jgi:DinB superfamily